MIAVVLRKITVIAILFLLFLFFTTFTVEGKVNVLSIEVKHRYMEKEYISLEEIIIPSDSLVRIKFEIQRDEFDVNISISTDLSAPNLESIKGLKYSGKEIILPKTFTSDTFILEGKAKCPSYKSSLDGLSIIRVPPTDLKLLTVSKIKGEQKIPDYDLIVRVEHEESLKIKDELRNISYSGPLAPLMESLKNSVIKDLDEGSISQAVTKFHLLQDISDYNEDLKFKDLLLKISAAANIVLVCIIIVWYIVKREKEKEEKESEPPKIPKI